jgi:glycosyltransferase involved in cell wall biosynthesis
MDIPKISVIVPVFNAGLYLEKCINSLLDQTFGDFEIIAINDGSTDNSANILDAYSSMERRIRVFHRKHEGVSISRNFAIQQVNGKYISFADADDWMEPTMLNDLFNLIEHNRSDLAVGNVFLHDDMGSVNIRLDLSDQLLEGSERLREYFQGLMRFKYDNANWNKLYKTETIQVHHLRFSEQMTRWEDLLFNLQYYLFIDRISISAKPMYNYRYRNEKLSHDQIVEICQQFNHLYQNFLNIISDGSYPKEEKIFRSEIARIAYYELLPVILSDIADTRKNISASIDKRIAALKELDPGIFKYLSADIFGTQKIKGTLLKNGYYRLFLCSDFIYSKFRST